MKNFFFAIAFASLLSSCAVNPSEVSPSYAKNFIGNATYVKDARTGMCFAIVATRMTGATDQNGVSFTWVPCEQVEHMLVK